MTIKIGVRLHHPSAKMPTKGTTGSAGYDIYAPNKTIVPGSVSDNEGKVSIGRALISTGISVSLPDDTVGRLGSRSGMSVRSNIEVGAGWIDSDYRGEIKVELKNLGPCPFIVNVGDKIAQLIVLQLASVDLQIADVLNNTERGSGGFGSTGSG